MAVKEFLQNALNDMKESAKAQHEVDKANFAAAKAEAKANFEEAKAAGSIEARKTADQKKREEQIAEAQKRQTEAETRIAVAKGNE